jgi:hypothetical protein
VGGFDAKIFVTSAILRLNLGSANRRLSTDTALALVSAGVIRRIYCNVFAISAFIVTMTAEANYGKRESTK